MKNKRIITSMMLAFLLATSTFAFSNTSTNAIIRTDQQNKSDSNTPQFDWQPIAVAQDNSFVLLVEMVSLKYNPDNDTIFFTDNLVVKDKGFIVSDKMINCKEASTSVLNFMIFDPEGNKLSEKTFSPTLTISKEKSKGTLQEFENQTLCKLVH